MVCMACGFGWNVKCSAWLLGPMVALLLCIRALIHEPWPMPVGRMLTTPGRRLLAAATCCVIVAAFSWISIWWTYGFRYAPAVGPARPELFDMASLTELTAPKEM